MLSCGQRNFETRECQTWFDLAGFFDNTKRNARRLKMKENRLNEKLQKLQKRCDEFREQVKKFEGNRAVQAVRHSGQICKLLSNTVFPHLADCPLMWCAINRDPYHCHELCEMVLKKLLRLLLATWAGDVNSSVENSLKLSRKHFSPKVFRL